MSGFDASETKRNENSILFYDLILIAIISCQFERNATETKP